MANYNGVVKWYNVVKGYGFITSDSGDDVFVHFSNIKEEGPNKDLHEGEEVSFDIIQADKGIAAINVHKL
ncbi:cold-shock protein [Romboutsia lituseburensis]|uniref:cold-shock protein n=1 Tax=Romboutsia lituseburensis TaxID=1537 RepID=UPI00215A28D6|nr:cold shock domain-containing protein [Romboutsia lituseburensis]MCR8744815.1 cold shock domain-containing protein [Romboutsia lituseburensis]